MGLIFYKNNMFSVVVGYRIDISGTIVLVYISYDMCCYCAFPCKYSRTPHIPAAWDQVVSVISKMPVTLKQVF